MKRKIYDLMLDWKNRNEKSAFFIDGARRVGKTYIALEFAKNEYDSYIYIDFNNVNDDVKFAFENYAQDLESFFLYISTLYNVKLIKNKSCIIFDEVQQFPKARAMIKYLVEDGRYSYIETGSLVSIKKNVKNIMIPSEEHHEFLYPLDFEEFLWAMDQIKLFNFLKDSFINNKVIPIAIHKKALDFYYKYLCIGGMPQAILAYLQDKSTFINVEAVKQNILSLYSFDIMHYAERDSVKVSKMFSSIPENLKSNDKIFHFSKIDKYARSREYGNAMFWLIESGIVNVCYNTNEPNIGLWLNKERTSFKMYMMDTGLLLSLSMSMNKEQMNDVYKKIITNKLSFNNGMIVENSIAQMLKINHSNLYFYKKTSSDTKENIEIDFICEKKTLTSRKNINVIEVKSGKKIETASLAKFKNKFKDYINDIFIISDREFKRVNDTIYLPYYLVPLI